MLAKATNRIVLASLVVSALVATSYEAIAGTFGFGRSRAVGGIMIDSNGVLKLPTVEQTRQTLDALRLDQVPPEMKDETEIRKISLRQIEKALASSENKEVDDLPDALKFLAGIQRIKYIFVYPERNDIVLAGPGEGWKLNDQGIVVGETTGKPVVLLDDLLVAFRSVHAARQGGISCSIDPTDEGRRRFREFMSRQRRFSPTILEAAANALGPQQITVTGVPNTTHYARVLVAADYHMKAIAMQVSESPLPQLRGYLDMLKRSRVRHTNSTPRWWLASDYEPLAKSEDGLAWEIRGQGVKAMTETDIIRADGTSVPSGKSETLAQRWADEMTAYYDELSTKQAVFGQLRNVMDLSVVAAVIEHNGLRQQADCDLKTIMQDRNSVEVHAFHPPKTIDTKCTFVKRGNEYIITASGGVMVDSWQAATRAKTSPHVNRLRESTKYTTVNTWWSN